MLSYYYAKFQEKKCVGTDERSPIGEVFDHKATYHLSNYLTSRVHMYIVFIHFCYIVSLGENERKNGGGGGKQNSVANDDKEDGRHILRKLLYLLFMTK